ncbi:MAG: molybdopterin cofactor-binding domain-containing protein, partial [Pseudomonadota bacterium]|nr:molybdopterin cofactor-binding domain-containing protein [Pseudomonadota bacterium]
MSRLTRRIFLFGSATIAGGVAFGAYKVATPHPNPLVNDVREGGVTFNPWIMIDPTGVTLITAHTDVGQGVSSMEALLLAEELDLAQDGFETRFAAPDAAYFNTALAAEAVPFMPTDTGRTAETMRAVAGAAVKLIGLQLTGGSSAVPDSFDKLRQAGAMARETLRAAASKQTGVAVVDLRTENGAVVLPDGTRIPYPELAATAATIKPVNDVRFRDPSEWRLIGKPVPRRDIPAKSTGQQAYGIDLRLPDMLFASVRLSPAKGGALNGFDADVARSMNGVHTIVPVTGGIAAVADTTWTAIQAVNAVECDWAPADYPPEQDAHWDALSASFTEDNLDKVWREDGDVDAARPHDAVVVEAEYRAPYVAHQPLEPLNATALVTEDGAQIWTAHQIPQFAVRLAAKAIGMEPDQITFHQQFAGGSFGHRLEFEHVIRAVEIANQMRGTPVQMTLSREEDFAQDFPRQISMGRM